MLLSICVGAVGCAHGQARSYTMEPGDTLYSASRELGVPIDQLMQANGIADATRVPVGTVLRLPGPEGGLRPVSQPITRSSQPLVPNAQSVTRRSEPLIALSQPASGGTAPISQATSPISGSSMPITYTVVKGDTLYSIAARFDLDVGELMRINGIDNPRSLATGTALTIPGAGSRAVGLDGPLLWPTAGERQPLTGRIDGVTIRGAPGQPVRSVSTGTVTWSGPRRGYGYVVLVRNDLGYVYGYLGNEQVLVQAGDQVEIGSQIGQLGVNPHDQTAQLYFVVLKDGRYVDPGSAPRA